MQAIAKVADALQKIQDIAAQLEEKRKEVERLEAELGMAELLVGPVQELLEQVRESEAEREKLSIQEVENAIKTEDADFRSYTQKVCEFVADDEGFNRATAEYRKSRRLPDSDDEEAPDEKAGEELHRVA